MCQLEQKPDVELEPLNICLCPNCATSFKELRNNKYLAERLIDSILEVSESKIEENDHISVTINDYDFWFTPTHIAEIIELLKLKKRAAEKSKVSSQIVSKTKPKPTVKAPDRNTATPVQSVKEQTLPAIIESEEEELLHRFVRRSSSQPVITKPEEKELRSDTSAYSELIGRRVFHKLKKAYAHVVGCDGEYLILNFESGDKAGQDVSYSLAMCLKKGLIEVVD